MHHKVLQIAPADNVLVALQDLPKGEVIDFQGVKISLHDDVGAKHKFAITALAPGDAVKMYGVLVGKATQPIPAGGLISTENLAHAAENFGARQGEFRWTPPEVSRETPEYQP